MLTLFNKHAIIFSESGVLTTNPFHIMPTEAVALGSLAHVRDLIRDEKTSDAIFEKARVARFANVSRKTHALAPVLYMGTGNGSPESGYWEVGIVPKQVICEGARISTRDMLLYRADADTVRGPDDCVMNDGRWERYPD